MYEAFCMTEDLSIIMEEYNRFPDQPQCQGACTGSKRRMGRYCAWYRRIGQKPSGRDQGGPAAGGFRRGLSPGVSMAMYRKEHSIDE